MEDILVEGAIDLMYPADDGWVIVDWKTGQNDSEESSLQLLTYALWAHEEFDVPLEAISLFKAFLTEGVAEPLLFSWSKNSGVLKPGFCRMLSY